MRGEWVVAGGANWTCAVGEWGGWIGCCVCAWDRRLWCEHRRDADATDAGAAPGGPRRRAAGYDFRVSARARMTKATANPTHTKEMIDKKIAPVFTGSLAIDTCDA